mgnify:FL=1
MRETTKAKVALCAFIFMYGVIGLVMVNDSWVDNVIHVTLMVLSWVALMYQGVLSSNNKNKGS